MKILETILLIILIIISIVQLPNIILNRNLSNLKYLTLILVFQNIVCVLANDTFGKTVGQLCIIYKEFILYGSICTYLVITKKVTLNKKYAPFLLELILLFLFFLIGSASIFTRLICLRQIMTPIILVLYGSCIKLNRKELESFIKFIVNIGLFQSIFGLIERFLLGDNFWLILHIEKFMDSKGFGEWTSDIGLPGNYYSFDLYSLVGSSFRRLVGISTDPLLTAHFLSFCVVLLLFNKVYKSKIKQNIILIIMIGTIFFTLSKGGILIIALACLCKIWKHNKVHGIVMVLIMGICLALIISTNFLDTVAIHASGLTTTFSMHSIFGNGLGSWGNYAKLYEGTGGSGESYMGLIIGQTGLIGFVVFLYAFIRNTKIILKEGKSTLSYAILVYVISVLIEAFLSESAINYIGSGISFIIFGIMMNSSASYKNNLSCNCLANF
jgi:hypothetical protein